MPDGASCARLKPFTSSHVYMTLSVKNKELPNLNSRSALSSMGGRVKEQVKCMRSAAMSIEWLSHWGSGIISAKREFTSLRRFCYDQNMGTVFCVFRNRNCLQGARKLMPMFSIAPAHLLPAVIILRIGSSGLWWVITTHPFPIFFVITQQLQSRIRTEYMHIEIRWCFKCIVLYLRHYQY